MFKDRIEEIVAECLHGIEGRDRYELVSELAIPVPVGVIADLLSVPTDRYADVRRWSDMVANLPQSEGRGSPETTYKLFGMLKELSEFFVPLIEDRRENPRDDMISDLVRAVDVDTMTVTETVLFILVMMSAGNETTTNLIGNTVVELLRNRDQLDLLLSRPDLVPSALEEGARAQAPFQFLHREALQDVRGLRDNDTQGQHHRHPRRCGQPRPEPFRRSGQVRYHTNHSPPGLRQGHSFLLRRPSRQT